MALISTALATKNKLQTGIPTASVCPVCLKRIPAARVFYADEVYLEKTCPEHGFFKTVVWRGLPAYPSWMREKIPNHPAQPFHQPDTGCPFDCGLCSAHRQEPCCVLLEVTQRCDLGCPVCFASSGNNQTLDPHLGIVELWYRRMLEAGGPYNIQLSGGEPCLRDDLPEIIRMGKALGFDYFQVNTNGLRLSEDIDYLKSLKKAGLNVVYLQFDGTDDTIYQTIRGRAILQQKIKAIQNCADLHLGVILVPTIVPGVNDHDLGGIIRFALAYQPAVKGIHFQPVTYFGRYPLTPRNEDRITIPELLRGFEAQTEGLVHMTDFHPKGSENSYCSFSANYIIQKDGSLKPIRETSTDATCGCHKPESAKDGVKRSRAFVAKHWTYHDTPKSISTSNLSLGGWDELLERSKSHHFSISGMVFQDAWNLDLELLQDCCIAIAAPKGDLVPFCAYNLTNTEGQALYRPKP
jgi:uncharacterized radical SAM superfamily Fe-S cluster-containing enzyme